MAEKVAAGKGATSGRVRGTMIPGTRVFYRPSMGKIIFRPINVIRSSDKVLARNEKLRKLRGTGKAPPSLCKGKGWKEFVSCLSTEMTKI
jgi:hypothetical protein